MALDISLLTAIITGSGAIGGSIYGGIRLIYCRGRKKQADDDELKVLKERVDTLFSELDKLTADISQYRKETKDILKSNQDSLVKITESVAFIQGKMSKRDKSTTP